MTVSWNAITLPRWYFSDNTGRPLGAGKMYARRSLNKTAVKPIFMDPNGLLPWPDPIVFELNGMQGPFFFEFDSDHPEDLYFLEVEDMNGNQVFTQDNWGNPGANGGGGGGTTTVTSANYIANNVFLNNSGTLNNLPNGTTVLAPGNHAGFSTPDNTFVKIATTIATDSITYPAFGQGNTPLTGDNTPTNYVQYISNSVVGETRKAFQFPIQPGVKSMESQPFTFTIWMQSPAGSPAVILKFLRHFGSGGAPNADVLDTIQTVTLSPTWTKTTVTFNVPSSAPYVIGNNGDDGNYLLVEVPSQQAVNIGFTKPSCYFGNLGPTGDFENSDQINSIINTPRTADIRFSVNNFTPFGWVPMNDGSIGNAASGATTRHNQDTFFLFKTIWNNVDDSLAPVSGGRSGSAEADFAANKNLTLTRAAGRAFAATGSGSGLTARTLGQFVGGETGLIGINHMPSHAHPGSTVTTTSHNPNNTPNNHISGTDVPTGGTSPDVNIAPQGGNQPFPIMQPTAFYNAFLKL